MKRAEYSTELKLEHKLKSKMAMKIKTLTEVDNCIRLNSVDEIEKGDRLFFMLYPTVNIDWNLFGKITHGDERLFMEVIDVEKFINKDERMKDKNFIEHHNFYILKGT